VRGAATLAVAAVLLAPSAALWAQESQPADAGAKANQPTEPAETKSGKSFLEGLPFELHGFGELRGGVRTQKDPHQSKDVTLGETRFQLEPSKVTDYAELRAKVDFLYDAARERADVDVREFNALLTPAKFLDVKLGRQILTWGTGDYLFINDLFPKDYKSFFLGRDDEYLKAPSDAAKVSAYSDLVNMDLVYTPRFNPDRFIDGERISYFSPLLGRLAGEDAKVHVRDRNDWFEDSETALRLSRNIGGYDVALYGYEGFWKDPVGFDPSSGRATFPRLGAYGASARGNVWKGIGHVEAGYYDSRDDGSGHNPFIPNSQVRFLVGYEQEVAEDFTVGGQYYLEHMMDGDAYRRSLPAGSRPTDENRHVLTVRLTKLAMYQNLKLSLFLLYSPSDHDAYLRPNVHYRINDHWSVEGGASIFVGESAHTFCGQFRNDTNVYCGLRYSF
jgi:hypothetical protein